MMPPPGGGADLNDSGVAACHLRGVLGELSSDRSESCRNVGVELSEALIMPGCKRVICPQIRWPRIAYVTPASNGGEAFEWLKHFEGKFQPSKFVGYSPLNLGDVQLFPGGGKSSTYNCLVRRRRRLHLPLQITLPPKSGSWPFVVRLVPHLDL